MCWHRACCLVQREKNIKGNDVSRRSDFVELESDERLVAAANIGHKGAFDDLYQRHAGKMNASEQGIEGREDTEDA